MSITAGFRLSIEFVFAGAKTGGWTENFWNASAFPGDVAPPYVYRLVELRNGLCSNQCVVKRFRMADLAIGRNSRYFETGFVMGSTNTELDGDIAQAKLYMRFRAAENYSTGQWLGGIKDTLLTKGGAYAPTGLFQQGFNGFLAQLKGNGWRIVNQNRAAPFKPIAGMTNAGVVTVKNHPFATDDYVRVKNVHGFTEANRIWRVTNLTVDTVQLVGWIAYQNPPNFSGLKAVMVKQDPVMNAILSCDPLRGSKHDVGRPTGQLSGRRRRPKITPALLVAG